MLPKERMIAALEHREPDRVPIGELHVDAPIVEEALGHPTLLNARWKGRVALWQGERDMVVRDYCRDLVAFARKFEWDYVVAEMAPSAREDHRPAEMLGPFRWRDSQGRIFQSDPDSGEDGMIIEAPTLTIDDIVIPPDPTPIDETCLEAIERIAKELGGTHFVIARVPDGTFPWPETMPLADFLIKMIQEPDLIRKLIASKLKTTLAYIEAAAQLGVDAIVIGTDYCDNRGPIMGPRLYREFIYPALEAQVEATHKAGKYFVKHSDGNQWPILDSYVEAGVDVWHGIQPSIGMDLRLLKEKYGSRLAFFGGVNVDTLVMGTPDEVEAEVRYAIRHAAPGGGFAMTSGNSLLPGTKYANYVAMVEATRRWGAYPIRA